MEIKEADRPKRMSVKLPADSARMLEELAQTQDVTQTEILRKAIAREYYFAKELGMGSGSKLIVKTATEETKEVIFL